MDYNKGTEQVKHKMKQIFTAKRLKIGAAVLVVCAIAAGGGAWYHHQQKLERRAQVRQAQTRMVEYQAAQRSMKLLEAAQIRSLTAQAIGKDESAVDFREVTLENRWDDDEYAEHKERREIRRSHTMPDRDNEPPARPAVLPQPQSAAPVAVQPQAGTGRDHFYPVYEVKCIVDNVKYEFKIDAITGKVLESEVEPK
ncbi:hypothetical protein AB840_02405 [Megasphaera cerevisiae DSM 20462]|jgi:uncharacterized membrane protein YkoI|uniref:PepSY domain-containing protein n=1 Tax=Megasphaera cerevisiae DSM 20462 TaxID=1122219 RepID=A0A0J6WYT3_9FIRM|nr:PepSY domain-containing protein [Megasphaera cerevisiae]KMO87423.1 hypothetical protein AB840_02405 [Megasphaera cerevisiae DSM 20462]MCI1750738.1 PepSY domain-containing protein [Megasphaera cerevisiae]OKY53916.1 hypothetical protein BSR42_04955 [Megasphaera cerevisiae]SJZ35977.1 Uncharacterized enzyme of heme biosynthesis [Megasphaera cerevisiae DSM 20462]